MYLSKVLVDSGTMAEIEMEGVLTRERMCQIYRIRCRCSLKKSAGLVRNVLCRFRRQVPRRRKQITTRFDFVCWCKALADLIKVVTSSSCTRWKALLKSI